MPYLRRQVNNSCVLYLGSRQKQAAAVVSESHCHYLSQPLLGNNDFKLQNSTLEVVIA